MRGYETPRLYPSAVLVSPTFTHSVKNCISVFFEKGSFLFFSFICVLLMGGKKVLLSHGSTEKERFGCSFE